MSLDLVPLLLTGCLFEDLSRFILSSFRLSLSAEVFLLTFFGKVILTETLYELNISERKEDYGLAYSDVFLNLTQTPLVGCFSRCSSDCRCGAFQMFKDTECQLLSSSRFEMMLQHMPGYTYYDMVPRKVRIVFS